MKNREFFQKKPLVIFLSYFKNHKGLFAIDIFCACLIAAVAVCVLVRAVII